MSVGVVWDGGFGFVLNAWDQRPLEWRSAIVRAQSTSEGYSVRFYAVCVIKTIVVTADQEIETKTMELKQLYKQIIP